MRIKKVQLKNGYKRFFDLTIDLGENPKRIVALIGRNGCGKSSVLDGMLYHNSAYGAIGNKGHKDYKYHSMDQDKTFNHNNIVIKLADGDFTQVRQKNGNTIFSFRSSYRYNSALNVSQLKGISEIQSNGYGASLTIDLDDKVEENYRRLRAEYNKYMKSQDCKPSDAMKKIIGDLNAAITNCLDLKIVEIRDIEDEGGGTLFFSKTDQDVRFEFNVLSAGEKEVVDLLLDLYLRKDYYVDSIFLFDEPDLHVSTAIQRKLLVEINKLVGPNCQIWITTHSIGFMRALQVELKDDCQVIDFNCGDGLASSKCTLVPMVQNTRNWRKVFQAALDDLSGLVCPKMIIYCEGKPKPKNDTESGIDAIVYNNIFSQEYPDVQFVSCGSCSDLNARRSIIMAIINKSVPDLELLVLRDRDDMKKQAQEQWLSVVHNRLLKRRELENYLFDKEVLATYARENSTDFKEDAYCNLIKNISDDDVKGYAKQLHELCSNTTKFNKKSFYEGLSKVIQADMAVFKELKECIFGVSDVSHAV